MKPEQAAELAEAYIAPEAAAALIVRACDTSAPELQRRALHALRWLDPEEMDPPLRLAHGGVGDALAGAVVTLCHSLIYHADLDTRQRCARLVQSILDEAARVADAAPEKRCA